MSDRWANITGEKRKEKEVRPSNCLGIKRGKTMWMIRAANDRTGVRKGGKKSFTVNQIASKGSGKGGRNPCMERSGGGGQTKSGENRNHQRSDVFFKEEKSRKKIGRTTFMNYS